MNSNTFISSWFNHSAGNSYLPLASPSLLWDVLTDAWDYNIQYHSDLNNLNFDYTKLSKSIHSNWQRVWDWGWNLQKKVLGYLYFPTESLLRLVGQSSFYLSAHVRSWTNAFFPWTSKDWSGVQFNWQMLIFSVSNPGRSCVPPYRL